MTLTKTLLFFWVPGLVIFLMFTFAYKPLVSSGIPICWATYICLWVPLIIMLAGIFYQFRTSKLKLNQYFWINKLEFKEILIVVAGLILVQTGEALLGFSRPLIESLPGFQVPDFYPDLFQVDVEIKIPMQSLLGIELPGNVFPLFFFAIWLFTNIFCEEFLWRGYALPRMEMAFGKWAWLINGLLWNFAIHFFFRYSFITLMPISLIVPYLSQKYKSIWPGVIIHGIGNLLIYVIVIPSYLS